MERLCQNCCYFFQDQNDYESGVCMEHGAEEFEPYMDTIIEEFDFSICYDLYLKKRYNAETEACEQFEENELIEESDEDDIQGALLVDAMKNANTDEVIKYLYSADHEMIRRAIAQLEPYIQIGNKASYGGLFEFYMGLGSADTLEDVHTRLKIVDVLSRQKTDATIHAFVNELSRTPSNNTTRALYSEILKHLRRYPAEMVHQPLEELLDKREYSYKIKNRIQEIIDMY